MCHFVETYESGATPNPCIECNRKIKFNLQLLISRKLDFDLIVTDHYTRIKHNTGGRHLLLKALDAKKDQSYILYSLLQQQLKNSFFPLGGLTKNKGLIRYTIGQGLGVAANVPVCVTGKSVTANTVTLAPDEALYSKPLEAVNINFIV